MTIIKIQEELNISDVQYGIIYPGIWDYIIGHKGVIDVHLKNSKSPD